MNEKLLTSICESNRISINVHLINKCGGGFYFQLDSDLRFVIGLLKRTEKFLRWAGLIGWIATLMHLSSN